MSELTKLNSRVCFGPAAIHKQATKRFSGCGGMDSKVFLHLLSLMVIAWCAEKTTDEINLDSDFSCDSFVCLAGRECKVQENLKPACVCISQCEPHSHPVCGSDDTTYPNHCELHRTACIAQRKIRVVQEGHCTGIEKRLEKNDNEAKGSDLQSGLACYQIERDEVRQLLMDWLEQKARRESWIRNREDSYSEGVRRFFNVCDKNVDHYVSADEFLECTEKSDPQKNSQSNEQGGDHILRGLCVDALISMADTNGDWELDLMEFLNCLNPSFIPPTQRCALEDDVYDDGAVTHVKCSVCICACGNWVCTGSSCDSNRHELNTVMTGSLPTIQQRDKLLNGFVASDTISVDTIEREITRQYHSRKQAKQSKVVRPQPPQAFIRLLKDEVHSHFVEKKDKEIVPSDTIM